MRVETSIGVHTGVENEADFRCVIEQARYHFPRKLGESVGAFGSIEDIFAVFFDGEVEVHSASVDAGNRFGEKGRRHTHRFGHLSADKFVEGDIVARTHNRHMAEVEFELRGRHLRVILFVFKSHGALGLGTSVDKQFERVEGKRMIISAGGNHLKRALFAVILLGIASGHKKSFHFPSEARNEMAFLFEGLDVEFELSTKVGGVEAMLAVIHIGKENDLSRTEDIGRHQAHTAPIGLETEVRFAELTHPADRGSVEGEIFERGQKERFVVVEHMKSPFDIGKAHGDRFD